MKGIDGMGREGEAREEFHQVKSRPGGRDVREKKEVNLLIFLLVYYRIINRSINQDDRAAFEWPGRGQQRSGGAGEFQDSETSSFYLFLYPLGALFYQLELPAILAQCRSAFLVSEDEKKKPNLA